ncbi:MAG: PD-(D/E)XK nuclease domain-containing protein [Lachnospiraceae bacterium]|nr:PD-(D/E)XK nuclease domain-containing protein [Lachnospiraceae bacterium]
MIKFAYIAAIEQYLKIEELPSGKGIADVVYLPKRKSTRPALVVELKWNKSSEGAIEQIKEKNYPAVIKDYGGEILLVGINYDEKLKTHSCVIERI